MNVAPSVLTALNHVLRESLTAINQFFLHGRMLRHQGYKELNERIVHQSIDEMKMSDKLVQRIFLLDGLPNLQDLGKLMIGENVSEILSCDLQLEQRKHGVLMQSIALCEQEQDYVSRDLLETLKHANEKHIDWLECQHGLIKAMGLQNYLQSQV